MAGNGEGGMPCDNVLKDGDAVGGVLSNMVGWVLVGRRGGE